MGATIHYNGSIENRAHLDDLLDAARLFCAEQRWGYLDIEEQIVGQVERDEAQFPIDDTLHGISIMVHRDAEPMWLTFNSAGALVYYMQLDDKGTYWEIKSLFAKVRGKMETHIAICEFLRQLRDEYMPGLNVYDESGYFESGNTLELYRSTDGDDNAEPFDEPEGAQPILDTPRRKRPMKRAPQKS